MTDQALICCLCDAPITAAQPRVHYGKYWMHKTCDRKARAGRTRAKILQLLLSHQDGTRPVLVIPKGGGPYIIWKRKDVS